MIPRAGLGVSILKLLGRENSKMLTPSRIAAFVIREPPPNKVILRAGLGISILKPVGRENSKMVAPSQAAAFLNKRDPRHKVIPRWGLRVSILKFFWLAKTPKRCLPRRLLPF